jgi:outer membrane protein assembly factor BamB
MFTITVRRKGKFYLALFSCLLAGLLPCHANAQRGAPNWSAELDSRIHFYQMMDLGVVVVGTEKSLYAVEGETGQVLWRRRNARLNETEVAPVVGTDLLLLSFEKGGRTHIEAVDLLAGNTLWKSDKVKGRVMHLAVDPEADLAAGVFVRDTQERAREGFKRRPVIHALNLATGEELWKHELDSEVEMMPVRWSEKENEETAYTLDNYRPPLFLDGRLYLFYEGVTSLEARSGKQRLRERFRVNEEGLALTEADPVFDEQHIYASGRGRIRAIARATGRQVWEAKDLGLVPEMMLTRGVLYVRTGGQFTRLKDGEIVERGPYGVSALDTAAGKTLWRYKGADRGITNLALPNASTVVIADRDELVLIDAATGKSRAQGEHNVKGAAFVLVNQVGQAVVGGSNGLAAFNVGRGASEPAWRARHDPPGRGFLRTFAAVTIRAISLYFRYGGAATTAFQGAQLALGANTLRWSGLAGRASLNNLTDLAAGAGREHVASSLKSYGVASTVGRARNLRAPRPQFSVDVEERLLDRLDPAHQLERLSRFLWHRSRLAVLRGEHMYFYTDLESEAGRGLVGVNVNTGGRERVIHLNDPDQRFTTDEVTGQLYTAHDNRLRAYPINNRGTVIP